MLTVVLVAIELVFLVIIIMLFVFMGLPLIFPGAPFIPSYRRKNKKNITAAVEFAKNNASGRKMVDIGSGDGRVVIEFAKNGFESTGIEINPFLVLWSRLKIKRLGLKNAKIIRANFWKTDFSGFDVIYIFQLVSVNLLLNEKFKRELKTGAVVISVGFPLLNFDLAKKEGIFWIYKI